MYKYIYYCFDERQRAGFGVRVRVKVHGSKTLFSLSGEKCDGYNRNKCTRNSLHVTVTLLTSFKLDLHSIASLHHSCPAATAQTITHGLLFFFPPLINSRKAKTNDHNKILVMVEAPL